MQQKIMEVSKRRGIIFPSFEIYGGTSGFYDYGPVGSRIKENIENLLRKSYVIDEGCMEIQCPTLTPEEVWIASGHTKSFTDLTVECLKCKEPYKAESLLGEVSASATDIESILNEKGIKCPKCQGPLGNAYDYNLMFQTFIGSGKYKVTGYLRPETAQTTYLPFRRMWEIARKKLPFGVLQIGKSFRNEISPRQGIIRLREFNQAEIQYFVDPEKKETDRFSEVKDMTVSMFTKDEKTMRITLGDAVSDGIIKIQLIGYHLGKALKVFADMGINPEKLRIRQHRDDEKAFYSKDTWDVEFFSDSFGKIELVGISDRTDYDLSAHMKLSKQDMRVNLDGRKFVPHVIEVAYGIDRPLYCVLESCYVEEEGRAFFKFPKETAPFIAGVFPLVNKDGIPERARDIFNTLKDQGMYVFTDKRGSIGKMYARADEIGVPCCITVDYQTLEDGTVTVRDRDSKDQKRVKIENLTKSLN